jgi:prolyl oligopeptidase
VPPLPYPDARREDTVDDIHGVKVPDPYRWLEDAKNDDVQKWVGAEDALTRDYLAKLPGRDALAARMKELFYVERVGIPTKRGTRLFYPRRDAGKEKYIVYWRDGAKGAEKVLLDPTTWSNDGSLSLGEWEPTHDGKRVAYTVKQNNADEATLYVIDVATGKKSTVDVIPGTGFSSISWTPAGDGFYYQHLPPLATPPDPDRMKHMDMRFHKLGTDPGKDPVVHAETGDAKTFLGGGLSMDGRWLVCTIQHGWTSNDVYVQDLHAKTPAWQTLVESKTAQYDVSVDRGRLFVRTNEGAPHYRLYRVDPAHLDRASWQEIVAERPDATMQGAAIVGHRIVLDYLKDVVDYPELRDEDGKLVRPIPLPGLGSMAGPSGDPDSDTIYFSFQTFTYPNEIYEESVKTGKRTTWHKLSIPVDPSKYTVDQLFATSKDGTRVPFFVVHAKDMPKDGSTPTMLTGYGGFQISETPYFASSVYPWLEHGGAWVDANLRGGSEYGEDWHRHGMLHEKQHVFDDFFAVAEEIAKQGIARADKLAIDGGSNGGLLMGAAVTQRPELFGAVICEVPLLDMVRFPLFGIGKSWIPEYGNPEDPDDLQALFAYSPYHHVTKGTKYPPTLIMSADADDRVDPMHARKFAAELQWASTGGPVLLRVEKHSGHGGADMVKSAVDQVADKYAFALNQLQGPQR